MKFGMTEYQSSRPNSRPASPALSVSSTGSRTGRVTPRRERITNVVSPLSLEDINVSLGLGVSIRYVVCVVDIQRQFLFQITS